MESETMFQRLTIQKGIPQLMGAQPCGDGYNFSISGGNAERISLLLYRKGTEEVCLEIPLTEEYHTGNVAAIRLGKLPAEEVEYNYRIDGAVVTDPCARAITGRTVFGNCGEPEQPHRVRGILTEQAPSEIPGVFIPYTEMILYKLHVRGFTSQRNSGATQKGTFAGLVEKIPYLKELGVTSVELMPAYDFFDTMSSVVSPYDVQEAQPKRVNYWGYTDGYYFAPKGAYCRGTDHMQEFAQCVDAFHRAGMELLMEFYFPTEMNPMKAVEILRWWHLFYHVDGFHLVGGGVPIELLAKDELLKDAKLLGAAISPECLTGCRSVGRKTLAVYNGEFMQQGRCFLKGDAGMVASYVGQNRKNPEGCGVINYMACQDGFTLADMVTYNEKHNEANGEENRDGISYNWSWNCGAEGKTRKLAVQKLRLRQLKNAVLLLMLSQGTPMIYAGDERGNSQEGNNNAYCQDNPLGWTDWNRSKRGAELYAFVRDAIAFRKAHPILHLEHEPRDTDYLALGFPEISYHSSRAWFAEMDSSSHSVGMLYCGAYRKDSFLYIAYNMHWNPYSFALPSLPEGKQWYLAVDTSDEEVGFRRDEQVVEPNGEKRVEVLPRTIVILIGR